MHKTYLDYTLNGEKNTLVLRMEMLEKIVQQYNSQHKDDGGQIVINRYCSECSEPEVELNSDQETPPKKRKLACKKRKEASLRVAICTPLMARVHKSVPQSKEIAFLDSTSSLDRYNLSMFLLSICHAGGGLLLGVMIVSNEMTSTLKECLSSLESILPENALCGYKFPNVIKTDDSQSECQALSRT